jgi:hypothetical protein
MAQYTGLTYPAGPYLGMQYHYTDPGKLDAATAASWVSETTKIWELVCNHRMLHQKHQIQGVTYPCRCADFSPDTYGEDGHVNCTYRLWP